MADHETTSERRHELRCEVLSVNRLGTDRGHDMHDAAPRATHARTHELHFGDADVHARLWRESTVERFDADPFILRADGSVVERATGEVVSVALTSPSDLRSIIGSDPGTRAADRRRPVARGGAPNSPIAPIEPPNFGGKASPHRMSDLENNRNANGGQRGQDGQRATAPAPAAVPYGTRRRRTTRGGAPV